MPIPSTTAGQVQAGAMVPMVPYGSMIPYAHYHAVMMPVAASAATSSVPEGHCSNSTEQQRHRKEEGKRTLCE
jgi:hypothetical protein